MPVQEYRAELNAVAVLASDNRYYFDAVCFQRNYRSD